MRFYEVLVADTKYKSGAPLTYSSKDELEPLTVVTAPLRGRPVTGFILGETPRPVFDVKEISSVVAGRPLPYHCLELAQWLSAYYAVSLSEAMRQFAPSRPAVRGIKTEDGEAGRPAHIVQLELTAPLTADQKRA